MKTMNFFLFLMPFFFLLRSDCNGGGGNVEPDPSDYDGVQSPNEYRGTTFKIPSGIQGNIKVIRKNQVFINAPFENDTIVVLEDNDNVYVQCSGADSYYYLLQTLSFSNALEVVEFGYPNEMERQCSTASNSSYNLEGSISRINTNRRLENYRITETLNMDNHRISNANDNFIIPLTLYRDSTPNCKSHIQIAPPFNPSRAMWQITFHNIVDDAEIHMVINDAVIKERSIEEQIE
jgi:hypothetical protein